MKKFAVIVLLAGLFSTASAQTDEPVGQLRTNLYISEKGKTPVLMDGTLTQYHAQYSNDLDGKDARKMSNFSENWGMQRGTGVYVIERRHKIRTSDTIVFAMWNMRKIDYEIEFIAHDLARPGMTAVLEDSWLQKNTQIDLSAPVRVAFQVTDDPDSKLRHRFRLIMQQAPPFVPLPLSFVVADLQNTPSPKIEWATVNGNGVANYLIEKSYDGRIFTTVGLIASGNTKQNKYAWEDVQESRQAYYRVAAVEADGKRTISKTLQSRNEDGLASVTVFPNPVTASFIQLHIEAVNNEPFSIKLINSTGKRILSQTLQLSSGKNTPKIQLPGKVPAGIYRLEISGNDSRRVLSVVIQ